MQDFVYANPGIKAGDIVTLAGTAYGIPVVATKIYPPFVATHEDADVWALERGTEYQRVESRPLTSEELDAYEFQRDPRQALYNKVWRSGSTSPEAALLPDLVTLTTVSHDVHSGVQQVLRSAQLLVARRHVHVYDGEDIVTVKKLALSDLPAEYAALVEELTSAAQADDEDDWETL